MAGQWFEQVWRFFTSMELVVGLLWLGLAALTIALLVLMRTRWGQFKPMRKCIVLSLLAHLLLAEYATTVQIVVSRPVADQPVETALHISFVDTASSRAGSDEGPTSGQNGNTPGTQNDRPWEELLHDAMTEPDWGGPERAKPGPAPEPTRQVPATFVGLPDQRSLDQLPLGEIAELQSVEPAPPEMPAGEQHDGPQQILATPVAPGDVGIPVAVDEHSPLAPIAEGEGGADGHSHQTLIAKNTPGGSPAGGGPGGGAEGGVPNIYSLRTAPNRSQVAQGRGGTTATEAAVAAALKWLADNQAPDGRWDASDHAAGRELLVLGRDRRGSGAEADTGMTGLALLAFLAAGHTHREGTYGDNVRRGLEFLLRSQAANGSLAGQADTFAQMYCHAIATLAVSEAYGMTVDGRLREPLHRAVSYTVAAQDPIGGGWRYRPGEPGDMSQSGWQLLALKSAELAGIPIPQRTRNGVILFLRSVSSGTHGGLAAYRPGERPSRAMTAEALVCWQFLGLPQQHPAGNEAGDYLLGEIPGERTANVYYWYYATLGMYQLQGDHWQRWNDGLRTTLVNTQQKSGPLAGSWDPDNVWGGYGGRVFSTALSTLCLEVYYRFLPLYANAAPAETRIE